MDNTFQDPDDPMAISEMDEIVEKEVPVENFAPDQLSLKGVLMDEVAKHRYHLNRGDVSNKAQVNPGYNLLPAPVRNIKDLWGREGPLRGFLNKKDKKIVSTWVRLYDIDPIDFGPILNGKHAIKRSIAISMFLGLIDTIKICPDCNGTMKLQVNGFRNYIDKLHWKCCKDGRTLFCNTNPKIGKIKKIYCKKEVSIRSGI